jgi:hypothetical protein
MMTNRYPLARDVRRFFTKTTECVHGNEISGPSGLPLPGLSNSQVESDQQKLITEKNIAAAAQARSGVPACRDRWWLLPPVCDLLVSPGR